MQILAKDARHHGHKSKHDSDDHHNLQCRSHFMSAMGKMLVLDIAMHDKDSQTKYSAHLLTIFELLSEKASHELLD